MITQLLLMGLSIAVQMLWYTSTALLVGFAASVGWHLGKKWVYK